MDSSNGNNSRSESPGDEKKLKITVSSVMQGVKQTILEVKEKETVQNLKNRIETETEVLANRQIWLFKGKELKENNIPTADYGITADSTITMNLKMSTGIFTYVCRWKPNNPTATDMILMMPPIFPSNQDQLRKQIKGMNTVHRKPKKMSGTNATANIWTPEKQMEHELTRNRMKTLLHRKKAAPIFESEAGSVQSPSPVATPPGELTCTSPSSSSIGSISSICSLSLAESGDELMVTEKKLKTCFKKLSAAQQTMRCKYGRIFCDRHRRPHDHTCVIDDKQDRRIKLKKNNSKVGDGGCRRAKFDETIDQKKN